MERDFPTSLDFVLLCSLLSLVCTYSKRYGFSYCFLLNINYATFLSDQYTSFTVLYWFPFK